MEHTVSLKLNHVFRRLYGRGKSAVNPCLAVYCRKNNLGYSRLGLTVGVKLGKAVVRNRTKRRLRECVRPLLGRMSGGLYVFVARPSAAEQTFAQLNRQVGQLLNRAGALAPLRQDAP